MFACPFFSQIADLTEIAPVRPFDSQPAGNNFPNRFSAVPVCSFPLGYFSCATFMPPNKAASVKFGSLDMPFASLKHMDRLLTRRSLHT